MTLLSERDLADIIRGLWIHIKEKTPTNGQIILAIDTSNDVSVVEFRRGVFLSVAFGFDAYENNGSWESSPSRISSIVTHWMPLPPRPIDDHSTEQAERKEN
jgi:hypothetical protein